MATRPRRRNSTRGLGFCTRPRGKLLARTARADRYKRLQVLPQQVIYLHQLYRCAVHFNEGDQHPSARTVGSNDHLLIPDRQGCSCVESYAASTDRIAWTPTGTMHSTTPSNTRAIA